MKKYILPFALAIGSIAFAQATQERVGIGTSTPQANLDIEGDLKIETVPNATNEAQQLYRDSSSNIIMKSQNKPFNTLKYVFNMDEADADWLNGFDTKIPTSKYQLVLGSSVFTYTRKRSTDPYPIEVPALISLIQRDGNRDVAYAPTKQAYLEERDGTWWIYADFTGGRPYLNDAYKPISGQKAACAWEIYILAIDKNIVKPIQ